jgi:hypothetical protein
VVLQPYAVTGFGVPVKEFCKVRKTDNLYASCDEYLPLGLLAAGTDADGHVKFNMQTDHKRTNKRFPLGTLCVDSYKLRESAKL